MDVGCLKARGRIVKAIRDFFDKEGFFEVETPILVKAPDPCFSNEVLETKVKFKKGIKRAFLIPSPEIFIKRLLANSSFERVFEITRAFRNNEEVGRYHLLEFTILEWYRKGKDYISILKDCEMLINFIYQSVFEKTVFSYQGKEIDLKRPWMRVKVSEAFEKFAGVNLDEFLEEEIARKIIEKKGYQIGKETTWEEMFNQILLNEIEPRLAEMNKPVFLMDYPLRVGAMAKGKDKKYVERFELYIGGMEIANAFSELTDIKEQKERFEKELEERKERRMKLFDYDRQFLKNLGKIEKLGGVALGVDRLVMLFTNKGDINKTVSFGYREIFG